MGLEKINQLRKEKGLTIEELSKLSNIPHSTLKKISAGITTNPSLDTMKAIANALSCTLDDLDDLSTLESTPQVEQENDYNLSNHEKKVITAYRKAPDMQVAVDRILNITIDLIDTDNDIRTYKVAARNGKDTITLTKEQREELIRISKEPSNIPDGTF